MNTGILNLHVHTPFSDGVYTIDELCEAHLRLQGLPVSGIGVADHLFCTPTSRPVENTRDFERIFIAEMHRYAQAVEKARARWAGRMQVYCGCEINWPLNRQWLDVIRSALSGIDYVLFEFVDWAGLTTLANQARRWPCPIGLAHTDVTRAFPNTSLDQIVRTMANARIFYEVNAKLLPLEHHDRWFSVLPLHRVAITLGTDTHDDLDSIAQLETLYRFVAARGLAQRLLTPRVATAELAARTA